MVLLWRNHPDICRYMYTQHEISLAEHTAWFERIRADENTHLLLFEIDNTPLGFVNIHQKEPGSIADWGFYLAPEAPKGTGSKLGMAILAFVFEELCLHKLCAQALGYNHKSIRFHRRLGFSLEGVLRHQHFDGQHYHDVYCFGILASEWKPNQ